MILDWRDHCIKNEKFEPLVAKIEEVLSAIDAPLLHFAKANDDTGVTVQAALHPFCPVEELFKSSL